ncbi:MAG: hypothetical protein QXX08_02510 [Candidatus Bathyarchaeia archaeon]
MGRQNGVYDYTKDLFDNVVPLFCQDNLEKLVLFDAFIQFCQNPTSASAGYGIEKSYSFISMNLRLRYKLDRLSIERLLDFMKQHINKMYEINHNFYLWREQILDYILKKESDRFLGWYRRLFDQLDENDKVKFLFLLRAVRHEKSLNYVIMPWPLRQWYSVFFDKEEKISEYNLAEVMVRFGLGNESYYLTSRGYEGTEFILSPFVEELNKEYEKESPITEEQITKFFEGLTWSNIKLLDKCVKQASPVLNITEGCVTQTSKLIVETSKSFFAISPFACNMIKELIGQKKIQLTSKWTENLMEVVNSFVNENYPLAESKRVFQIEGSTILEIRHAASLNQKPVTVGILIAPYHFFTIASTTIIDEMRKFGLFSLEIVIMLKESLPTILEKFSVYGRKTLILFLDEKEEKFYVLERGALAQDEALAVDNFLSSFLPYFERVFPISKAWPSELKTHLENLRY